MFSCTRTGSRGRPPHAHIHTHTHTQAHTSTHKHKELRYPLLAIEATPASPPASPGWRVSRRSRVPYRGSREEEAAWGTHTSAGCCTVPLAISTASQTIETLPHAVAHLNCTGPLISPTARLFVIHTHQSLSPSVCQFPIYLLLLTAAPCAGDVSGGAGLEIMLSDRASDLRGPDPACYVCGRLIYVY